jgi:hypothetical protein
VLEKDEPLLSPADVARQLAKSLAANGQDYAVGGALALGYWAVPRGTVDVDITVYLPPDQPASCVRLLQSIGCELRSEQAVHSLTEHGFCPVHFGGRHVDIFLPTALIYERARPRRKAVDLGGQQVMVWDAETLCVFKMMFFRRKDLADVEQIIQMQAGKLDRDWVLQQLLEMYGRHDPRISQWQELIGENPAG